MLFTMMVSPFTQGCRHVPPRGEKITGRAPSSAKRLSISQTSFLRFGIYLYYTPEIADRSAGGYRVEARISNRNCSTWRIGWNGWAKVTEPPRRAKSNHPLQPRRE